MGTRTVGVVGASGRAAAASLVRAGLTPWVVDLFADRDTRLVASCRHCPIDHYPAALPELCRAFERGPVLYTGGLENHLEIVAELAARHDLWGNGPEVLRRARDPFFLQRAAIPMPRTLKHVPAAGRWLRKSHSAGGQGIRWADANEPYRNGEYFQEYLDGPAFSAQYRTSQGTTMLLGITQQLIGTPGLHAEPFHYAGNIGPVRIHETELDHLGCALATRTGLQGVWGIDFILHRGSLHVLEVNPRYTAAMEVLEFARGMCVFDPSAVHSPAASCVGKAIYFAPRQLTFPDAGPWDADLTVPFDAWRLPNFADLPASGEIIERGRPVLTFFARGNDTGEVQQLLQYQASALDRFFMETTP